MIISCEKCQTRFTLDDDKIRAPFTKVRCSRCRHVFTVSPPEGANMAGAGPGSGTDMAVAPAGLDTSSEPDLSKFLMDDDLTPETPAGGAPEQAPVQMPADVAIHPVSGAGGAAARRWTPPWLWLGVGAVILCLVAGGGMWWYKAHKAKRALPAHPTASSAPPAAAPPAAATPATPANSEDMRDLHIIDYEGLYEGLQNNKGGNLLVIRGMVKNAGSQGRGPVTLQATLSNPEHKPVMQQTCLGGVTFSPEELRTLEPEKIKQGMESGAGKATAVVAAGKTTPFMVVFFGVPKNLAGYVFDLKIVSAPLVTTPPDKS